MHGPMNVKPPNTFSPTPLNSLEDIEEHPDDPNQADGDIQMEYFSDELYSPKFGSSTKKITCKNLGQCRYRLIIHYIQYSSTCLVRCCSD